MTTEQTTAPTDIDGELVRYLRSRLKSALTPDQDLFASGVVTSMFAMELVVHLEQTYAVAIIGADLKLANFRTVTTMAALVRRLRGDA